MSDCDGDEDEGDIQRLWQKAIQYMYAHFDQPLTMEKIAEAIHFSPGYLSRTFKAEMHVTVGEYLNRLRIEKAEGILKNRRFPGYGGRDYDWIFQLCEIQCRV